MGTYLSKPVTDKESHDTDNEWLSCGSSSMQGWRESQEDAHNCLLDFDKNVALFAVYDGHGGAEVAQYAADNLPSLVKNTLYDNQDFEQALIKAFMDFDDSLIEAPIVEKLIALREDINEECDEEEEREELNELYEEAKMPIEDIILKYKNKIIENMDKKKEKEMKELEDAKEMKELEDAKEMKELEDAKEIKELEDAKEIKELEDAKEREIEDAKEREIEDAKEREIEDAKEREIEDAKEREIEDAKEREIEDTASACLKKDLPLVTRNDACGSSSSSSSLTVTDDKTNVGNGIDECKTKDLAVESAKVNCSSNDNQDEENSEAECGPSSSNGFNGVEQLPSSLCIINDDSEDDTDNDDIDDDDYDDGDVAVDPETLNDNESDSDSDVEEEEEEELSMDRFSEDEDKPGKDSGCTAVMALLVNNKLYVANAGDSRCVVSVGGKAHDMSKDHKPEDEPELKRINKAGGRVSSDGRVNGGLNLSRALGDHNYKKNKDLPNTEQMITALPDVTVLDITPDNNNFIVLACDGIWNSLSSQEVVDFISERINKPDVKLSSICEELFEQCLAPNTLSDGTGCDNMTCIIVKLKSKQKRSRSDDEDDSEGVECKKQKSEDSIESESVH